MPEEVAGNGTKVGSFGFQDGCRNRSRFSREKIVPASLPNSELGRTEEPVYHTTPSLRQSAGHGWTASSRPTEVLFPASAPG